MGFEGKTQGTRVLVYGVSEGEVKLELRFEGSVVASYRALVRERKSIPCRVTILDGGIGARPLSDGDAIYRHIEAANRYLRPAGVALELDIDNSTKNGAALLRQGIFKITGVPPGDTANVPTSGFPMSWRYNYRSKVLNIIYIHSFVSPPGWTVGGQCPIYPKTKAIASTNPMYAGWFQTTDIGTPSSSWIKPSGVWPDGGAYSVTIRLIPERKDPSAPDLMATVGIPNLFTGSQTSAIALRKYGYTIAHEVGHALSLAHRGDGGQDGQSHPKKQNLMYQHTMPLLSQSIDIVQALAIHESPILR